MRGCARAATQSDRESSSANALERIIFSNVSSYPILHSRQEA